MSSALFGSSGRSSTKNLVEFKAGKMYLKGKMVHPDKRKGLLYLYQADDSLMHFCWKDRTSGAVEEDSIIFPDDCEFKRVRQCTTGRVYVLKFKSHDRRLFFWLQEPKTEKDEDHCRKVNELLNNPPTPGSQRSSSSTPNPVLGGTELSNLQSSDLQNFIGNISQQQLMQIFGSGVPSLATLLGPNSGSSSSRASSSSSGTPVSSLISASAAPATTIGSSSEGSKPSSAKESSSSSTAASSGSGPNGSGNASNKGIELSDLQNILSGIRTEGGSPRVPVDLGSAMTAEALQPILTNENFVEQLKPFLPPTGDQLPPVDQLKGTVTSPQFQQAVNLFTNALQSGQLGPLINQFGLGEDAVVAASSCDMEAFIKALEKKNSDSESTKKEDRKEEKDADKDEDDSMACD